MKRLKRFIPVLLLAALVLGMLPVSGADRAPTPFSPRSTAVSSDAGPPRATKPGQTAQSRSSSAPPAWCRARCAAAAMI